MTTIQSQARCAKRILNTMRRTYPYEISRGRIDAFQASLDLETMADIVETLNTLATVAVSLKEIPHEMDQNHKD